MSKEMKLGIAAIVLSFVCIGYLIGPGNQMGKCIENTSRDTCVTVYR